MTSEHNKRSGFKSRASLAGPQKKNLNYKERLAMSSKGKDACKVDLSLPVDNAGYITC